MDLTLEEKLKDAKSAEFEEQKEKLMQQIVPNTVLLTYGGIHAGSYQSNAMDYGPSYRNVTDMRNLPLFFPFDFADFPRGLYGTYNTLTEAIHVAEHARADIEHLLTTKIHENMLHKNGKLPDGYVLRALEAAIAGEREKPRYKR